LVTLLSVSAACYSNSLPSTKVQPDIFNSFIQETYSRMPSANSGIYIMPEENDFIEWNRILRLFRGHSYDSCKQSLMKYNYELIQIKDVLNDNVYDILREKYPVRYGWGTYIFNRNFKKRLHIHVNHPVDDPNAINIGADMFRQLRGEWLMIGGASRKAIPGKLNADAGRMKQSIFEYWHEMLSNLSYVAISIHSYDESQFQFPINSTDLIISNGCTSDQQWGISQLSMAFRDTMRYFGYNCGLAMYDSGFARLSGGWNTQGVFSNDSVGFGHWIYVELSKKIREKPWEYGKLISALDHALDLTGKKISQQVNRGFGLVSPRVVRVDSLRRLFFPPANVETYRIISFDSRNRKNDTIDVRMGNWMNTINSKKAVTAVTVLDTNSKDMASMFRQRNGTTVVSKIMESPKHSPSMIKFKIGKDRDSVSSDDDDEYLGEPLQVHRIPLQPILKQSFASRSSSDVATFKWEGIVSGWFAPSIPTFELGANQMNIDEKIFPRFLIPLVSNSYKNGRGKFLGVQMTNVLVNEIARLVSEYQVFDKDIGLLAEQSEAGDFYLRIFPGTAKESVIGKISN